MAQLVDVTYYERDQFGNPVVDTYVSDSSDYPPLAVYGEDWLVVALNGEDYVQIKSKDVRSIKVVTVDPIQDAVDERAEAEEVLAIVNAALPPKYGNKFDAKKYS